MGRNQLQLIINDFINYRGALTNLRRCARLNADGFWVFLDGYAVADKAIREHYVIESED